MENTWRSWSASVASAMWTDDESAHEVAKACSRDDCIGGDGVCGISHEAASSVGCKGIGRTHPRWRKAA